MVKAGSSEAGVPSPPAAGASRGGLPAVLLVLPGKRVLAGSKARAVRQHKGWNQAALCQAWACGTPRTPSKIADAGQVLRPSCETSHCTELLA